MGYVIRFVLQRDKLCPSEQDCPDRVFRCGKCGYCSPDEPANECPECGAHWKCFSVTHGPTCPMHSDGEDIMASASGHLVKRAFRLLAAKNLGITITLIDITEEELRCMEAIESTRQKIAAEVVPPVPRPVMKAK